MVVGVLLGAISAAPVRKRQSTVKITEEGRRGSEFDLVAKIVLENQHLVARTGKPSGESVEPFSVCSPTLTNGPFADVDQRTVVGVVAASPTTPAWNFPHLTKTEFGGTGSFAILTVSGELNG